MTNLKQSFKAAQYHKRMTISLFVLFSIFLLLITFTSQLIETQKFNLNYLLGKWDQLKNISPQFDTNLSNRLLVSNDLIIHLYNDFKIILIILSFLFFFFLSLYVTKSRKEEIYSLNYIGIKRRKILPRFLLELSFPVILSLPVIFCAMWMFHSQLINKSIEINQQVFIHYFETDQVARMKKENFNLKSEVPDNKKNEPLIPYNKTSILDVDIATNSLTHIFKSVIKNFTLLYLNMIFAYIVGFYCYTTFGFRRRRLIE